MKGPSNATNVVWFSIDFSFWPNIRKTIPMKGLTSVLNVKKTFKHKRQLKAHEREHSHDSDENADTSFECEICKKTFTTKSGFRGHQRTHSEKSHECITCGKRFRIRSILETHEMTHSQEKNIPVPILRQNIRHQKLFETSSKNAHRQEAV